MNMDIEKGAVDIEEGKRDKSMQEKNIRRQNESFNYDPRKAFESNIEKKKELEKTTLLTSSRPLISVLHSYQSVNNQNHLSPGGIISTDNTLVLIAASSLLTQCCKGLDVEDVVFVFPEWSQRLVPLLLELIYSGQGNASCQDEREELETLVAVLGIGRKTNLSDCQKPFAADPDAKKSSYEECMSVKSELDSSLTEQDEPSEVPFRHFLDQDQDDEHPVQTKTKFENQELNKERMKYKSDEIKIERDSGDSDLDNDDAEEYGNNFIGNISSKKFTKYSNPEGQEMKETGQKFKCQHCPKVFDRPGLRRVHEQLHTKPFKCDECDASFGRKSNLIGHQRIHRGERPFICDLCGRGFPIQSSLLTHKKQSHPEGSKPWFCDFCEHRFVSKSQLEIHRRVHTGEKPWICDTCGRGFTTKQNMLDHTRLHNDKMEFCCTKCGQQFKWKQSLERHLMDHTGVRPHPCSQCNLTFKTSNSLKKHKLSVHSDIKHFACQFCGSRFSTSSGVLRHQKKQRCSALRPGDKRANNNMEDMEEDDSSKELLTSRGGGGVNLVKQEGQGLQEVSPGWRSLALIRGEHQGLVGGQNASQSHLQAYRHNMPP